MTAIDFRRHSRAALALGLSVAFGLSPVQAIAAQPQPVAPAPSAAPNALPPTNPAPAPVEQPVAAPVAPTPGQPPQAVTPSAIPGATEPTSPAAGDTSANPHAPPPVLNDAASTQLEGEKLDASAKTTPGIHGFQAVGWWTLFGAVALTTTGGVFLGLMDAKNSDARRIAERYETDTGRHPLYGAVKKDYNDALDEAHTRQVTAHALLITGGVAFLASIPFFILHHRKAKSAQAMRRSLLEYKF